MRGRKCSNRREGADMAAHPLGEGFGDQEEMAAGGVIT